MRRIVFGFVFALAVCVALVACEQKRVAVGEKAPAPQSPPADPGSSASPESAKENLVIFSWWTAGGEADGLAELIRLFEAKYPNTAVENAAVAGGAGTNAKAVLKTRMLGGDAPGTFQVHGGSELIDGWVKTGYMAPLDDLFESRIPRDKFPAQLLDMVTHEGSIYSVPSNVHRGNVLWFNKKVFDDAGLSPPGTLEEMIGVSKILKARGITPLALGSRNKWETLHLFEGLLLAAAGPDGYRDLFAGKTPFDSAAVKEALKRLAALMEFVNADHSALTWDQACGLVQEGKAAMTVMGDWAKGYFLAQGWTAGVDYGAVPAPGTVGQFIVVTDTFGLPKKAPNPEATRNLLEIIGSIDGQVAFNVKKGSIPARTDAPMDAFDAIARQTMADFAKDTLVPSAAHGSAVREAFVIALNDELSVFLQSKNVAATAKALMAAAKDAGISE
ncbi:ABC transporter substrate-binding protein [bacterium]|nr:ABC transporter substrate-binding protein [bacterium]